MKKIFLTFTLVFTGLSSVFGQGKFSGQVFGDYFYNVARDANVSSLSNVATGGTTAFQGFQFRRIYLTYDNDLSQVFAMRFRLEADQTALFPSNAIGVDIKDAYLRWKNILSGSDLFFGIQPTPAFEISEGAWGYRSLEKTIMDLRGAATPRDFGIAMRGRLLGDGVSYWILFANGNNNKPENDKYKRYYAHLQLRPAQNFQITLNGDINDRAYITDPYNLARKLANGILTTAVFAGFSEPNEFSVGVEGFFQSTSNGYDNGTALVTKKGMGISAFGSFNIHSDIALVGRYDYYDPNTDRDARGDVRHFIVAGVAWKPDKNVSIIPNVQYETYEADPSGSSYVASLTGRVTVYFVFL